MLSLRYHMSQSVGRYGLSGVGRCSKTIAQYQRRTDTRPARCEEYCQDDGNAVRALAPYTHHDLGRLSLQSSGTVAPSGCSR